MATPETQATEAVQQQDVAHKILINYEGLGCPEQYTCHQCGAHGVRLWKDYATSKPEQTCAECTASLFPDEQLAGREETKGRIPAIPIQIESNGALIYGYMFEAPEEGWTWWESLPVTPPD